MNKYKVTQSIRNKKQKQLLSYVQRQPSQGDCDKKISLFPSNNILTLHYCKDMVKACLISLIDVSF